MVDSIEAAVGIYLGTLVIGVVSGAVPLINAEIYLIGLVAATPVSAPHAMALGAIVGTGQIVSQALVFKAAHGVAELGGARRVKLEIRIARARARVAKWGNKRFALLASSATFGIPPFLMVSIAGGVLEIPFRMFVSIGLAGRLVRFTTIGALTALL